MPSQGSPEPPQEESWKILFRGRVQGVGFRQSTCYLARNHLVRGRVKNLRDGSVELRVEGTCGAVQGLLGDIQRRFGKNIQGMEKVEIPCQSFVDFGVDY